MEKHLFITHLTNVIGSRAQSQSQSQLQYYTLLIINYNFYFKFKIYTTCRTNIPVLLFKRGFQKLIFKFSKKNYNHQPKNKTSAVANLLNILKPYCTHTKSLRLYVCTHAIFISLKTLVKIQFVTILLTLIN